VIYEGEWVRGKKEGRGTLIFQNGDTYEGEWKEGLISGVGIYHFAPDSEWNDPEL
jgi:hypothetical protein